MYEHDTLKYSHMHMFGTKGTFISYDNVQEDPATYTQQWFSNCFQYWQ